MKTRTPSRSTTSRTPAEPRKADEKPRNADVKPSGKADVKPRANASRKPTGKAGVKAVGEDVQPGARIDARIAELGDWRGATLARVRALIHEADPDILEEWKWRGVPVWSHDGIVCTGETYKAVVKLTFAKGATLPDPRGLFNSSLEGSTRRAIDIHQDEQLDAAAFSHLIAAAIALNRKGKTKGKTRGKANSAGAAT